MYIFNNFLDGIGQTEILKVYVIEQKQCDFQSSV